MAACKNCGAVNSDNAVYCEDCGAQMSVPNSASDSDASELEIGYVVDGRFQLEALVEAGPINRYRARQGDNLFMVWYSRNPEELRRQRSILQNLRGLPLVQPEEFITDGDREFAVGPWPGLNAGEERLEDLVTRQGPLNEVMTEFLARHLLETLHEVHEHGVLSRAIQPSRIWLQDDKIVLDLWDRATLLNSPHEESESIAVTPGFSAPEVYGLGQPCRATDLFSVGAVLHYCLSGSRPNFEARESFFTIAPPPAQEADSLVYVIMKSLSKLPSDRFPDAQAMLTAMEQPVPVLHGGHSEAPAEVSQHLPVPSPAPRPGPVSNGSAPQPRPGRNDKGVHVALKTDIGCVRSINQDACLELKFTFYEKSQPHEGHLITVIDGMGGEAEGDKAASIALRTIAQEVIQGSLALRDGRQTTPLLPAEPAERCRILLERALQAANRNIYEYACLSEARRGMGCTITACILLNGVAHFAHVGDTRGYHMRERLEQVTTDHSLVSRLVAMGTLTPEEARTSPQRSIIYRAMGTGPDLEVDLYDRVLSPGDRIVLCSDGIWEYYEAGEFAEIVQSAPHAEALCERLVQTCLKRGADDNATVAVIDV